MMRNVYGYIRVSTKEQNEDRQWLAMKEYGVPEGNVYVDKQSGKDFDRPGYRQVLEALCENDVLVIKSIDRLGRHFDELLEQWRIITVEKKAGIIVLDLPILNVGLENDLLGKVVAQLMLTLMSYMAETERDNIRQRQAEGIAAARLKGVHLGRKPKEIPEEFENVKTLWEEGECSATAAARRLGVDFHTFKKWVATCMGEESVGEEKRISKENV
jgi:DNA invertase Pin-like site-specific DNA recombinase